MEYAVIEGVNDMRNNLISYSGNYLDVVIAYGFENAKKNPQTRSGYGNNLFWLIVEPNENDEINDCVNLVNTQSFCYIAKGSDYKFIEKYELFSEDQMQLAMRKLREFVELAKRKYA